jgi:hypothetical protein
MAFYYKEKIHKKEVEIKKDWLPYHKLNIINGLTQEIVLMVTLSIILLIEMSHHCTIYLLKSHYNTLYNVVDTYRWKFSVGIFMDEFCC